MKHNMKRFSSFIFWQKNARCILYHKIRCISKQQVASYFLYVNYELLFIARVVAVVIVPTICMVVIVSVAIPWFVLNIDNTR